MQIAIQGYDAGQQRGTLFSDEMPQCSQTLSTAMHVDEALTVVSIARNPNIHRRC